MMKYFGGKSLMGGQCFMVKCLMGKMFRGEVFDEGMSKNGRLRI